MAVFTAHEIQALGSTSLVDVLRMVPGLNVESTGREGALSSLFARGGESDYNLVLIDGVRVNPSGGAYDFSRVSASEIDRLEVVRGGQSSLYGSDAIGSVVQVFTRRAAPGDAPQVIGSIEGGSFDTWRGDASVLGGARRRVDYQLGAGYRGTEGAFQDILPDHDTFTQTTVDAGVGAILGDRATLRTGLRYANAKGKAIGPIDYRVPRHRHRGRHARRVVAPGLLAPHLGPRRSVGAGELLQVVPAVGRHDCRSDLPASTRSSSGTPGALFPDSPRLVRLLDQPTFAAYQSGAQTLGAGQFLATTAFGVSDFTSTTQVGVPSAGVALSGERDVGRRSDAQRRLRLRARIRSAEPVVSRREPRLLRPAAVPRAGSLAGDARRAARPQLPLRQQRQPEAVARRLPAAVPEGRRCRRSRCSRTSAAGSRTRSSASCTAPPSPTATRTCVRSARGRSTPAPRSRSTDQRVLARVTYFDNAFNDQVAYKSTGFSPRRQAGLHQHRRLEGERVGARGRAAASRSPASPRAPATRSSTRRSSRSSARASSFSRDSRCCGGRSTRRCCGPTTRAAARRSTSTCGTSASGTTPRSSACPPSPSAQFPDRPVGGHHRQPGVHGVVAWRRSARQPRRRRVSCGSTT